MVVPLLAWHAHLLLLMHLAGDPSDSALLLVLSLVVPPLLPAWLPANQLFIHNENNTFSVYRITPQQVPSEILLFKAYFTVVSTYHC